MSAFPCGAAGLKHWLKTYMEDFFRLANKVKVRVSKSGIRPSLPGGSGVCVSVVRTGVSTTSGGGGGGGSMPGTSGLLKKNPSHTRKGAKQSVKLNG